MAENKRKARQSLAFSTPQTNRKCSSLSRRSLSNLDLADDDKDANETLFSTLMNDPFKKALLMQFLSYNKNGSEDVMELMKKKAKGAKQPATKAPFQSPIALHRQRALAAMKAGEEASSDGSASEKKYPRTAVPFNKLLQGVVAYVEIISQNQNRSAGVKALLKAMGAKVSDHIRKGITHAIIKDVSYDTYRKANMVKAHLVSVLWLEAVRKNHCKVPEKHYPALGPEACGANVSVLCEKLQKDYAAVVKDELERSRNLQRKIKYNLSSRFSEDIINTSQECDMTSIISGVGRMGQMGKTYESINNVQSEDVPSDTPSDSESEMGLVDGQIMDKREDSNVIGTPDATEPSVIKSVSEMLKNYANSDQSLHSRSSSLVRSVSKSRAVNKRQTSASKENLDSENVSDDLDLEGSLLKKGRKTKSLEKSKESQVLDVLSELQISNNRRSSRISSRTSSISPKEKRGNVSSSESNKDAVAVSETVPSLRVSCDSSKTRTTGSYPLSPLRISTESNKSKAEQPGVSESVPSLRVSSSSSKRRTTESIALSSLRISTDSSKSKKDSLDSNLSGSANLASAEQNSSTETPDKPTNKTDPFVNVTQRKKKKPAPQNLATFNDSDEVRNVEIAPVLMTPSAKRFLRGKLPDTSASDDDNCDKIQLNQTPSPAKKQKSQLDDHQFKTPGKLVKVKKVPQNTPLRRSSRRNSSLLEEGDKALSPKNRRSTLEFLPKESFRTPNRNKSTQKKPRKVTSIVCSRYHNSEVQVFTQIVHKLGGFFVEDEVSDKTSHLVLGEPKRTVNVLRALARGCWILRSEWLYKSLDEEKWLPEEDYEMTEYSSAVQKSRQERQAFGRSYSMDLFSNCGKIYIAKSTSPRCSDLQELVTICKGKVTTIHRNATVIVGEYVKGDATCVSVNWMLDSISLYKTQSFRKYLLEPPTRPRRINEDC